MAIVPGSSNPELLFTTTLDPIHLPVCENKVLEDGEDDDHDIYRGEPPSSLRSSSSSSMSSSTSSGHTAGPLETIAAAVELAISRWARRARGNSSSRSSTSSSSSSANSSTTTRTRSRRRRRLSVSTLRTMQSERNIAARRKALEESRQIPRNFALYVPPQEAEAGRWAPPIPWRVVSGDRDKATNERIIWTTSLPLVLSQVEAAMKRPSRPRRPRGRSRGPSTRPNGSTPVEYFERQELAHTLATSGVNSATVRKLKKGKQRDPHASFKRAEPPTECDPPETHALPKAWFLDVASPTWEDLRALGKVRHSYLIHIFFF